MKHDEIILSEQMKAGQREKLIFGATLTIGNYLATLLVADFLKQHPESRVQLAVHNTNDIVSAVARFELDVEILDARIDHRLVVLHDLIDRPGEDAPLAGPPGRDRDAARFDWG